MARPARGRAPAPEAPTRPRSPDDGPVARDETPRQALHRLLGRGPASARQLAGALDLREPEVVAHLEHLARSLRRRGERLDMEPARCRACGFVFEKRTRLARPGSCPECRRKQVEGPVFRLVR